MAQRMIANYLSFEKNPIILIEQVIKVRKFVLKKAVEATGLPIGTILFTSVLFLGLPTGLLFRCLFRGNKFMRALMAFVLGCVMSLMTFGESTKHCAYMAIPSLLLLSPTYVYIWSLSQTLFISLESRASTKSTALRLICSYSLTPPLTTTKKIFTLSKTSSARERLRILF